MDTRSTTLIMTQKVTLKIIMLICFALGLNYLIATLEAIRGGFKNAYIHTDLLKSENIRKVIGTGTKFIWNETGTDLWHKYHYQSGIQPEDSTQIFNTKGDIVPSLNIERNKNKTKTLKPEITNEHNGSISSPLYFIPNNSNEKSHVVRHIHESITKEYLMLPERNYTQTIVILTPIRNAEEALETFLSQLVKLNYPHHLISVYFGESGSLDKTFEKAQNISADLKRLYNFRDSDVTKLNLKGGIHGNGTVRHKKEFQLYRRAHLAMARNKLVHYALAHGIFDHVLWIDSDIVEFPIDLVQQMLFANADVVVTSCLIKSDGFKWLYDCNSWRETRLSLEQQSLLPLDSLVIECYNETERLFLPYLKSDGRVVKLDGVGGCALMIKAGCFRSGLQFPETVYKRHIETEGLAKMALDMGYSVVGLPFVEVFHKKLYS